MHPRFFGESHDMAKRQIMRWLAPKERWAAHPMWFDQGPEDRCYPDFPSEYAAALGVCIVDVDPQDRSKFFEAAQTCGEHLLLDPDTGLWKGRNSRKHVTVKQFVQIVKSPDRRGKLTLIYDQSYRRDHGGVDIWKQTEEKLRGLRCSGVHAAAYMAHGGSKVRFIWASPDPEAVKEATRRMQAKSGFPYRRFVDDGCGHVEIL